MNWFLLGIMVGVVADLIVQMFFSALFTVQLNKRIAAMDAAERRYRREAREKEGPQSTGCSCT